jgi:hypothetical protein
MPCRRTSRRRGRSSLPISLMRRKQRLQVDEISFPLPFPPGTTALFHARFGAYEPVSKTGMGGFVHRGFESLPLRCSSENMSRCRSRIGSAIRNGRPARVGPEGREPWGGGGRRPSRYWSIRFRREAPGGHATRSAPLPQSSRRARPASALALALALVQRHRPVQLVARDPVRVGGDPFLQRLRSRGGGGRLPPRSRPSAAGPARGGTSPPPALSGSYSLLIDSPRGRIAQPGSCSAQHSPAIQADNVTTRAAGRS